MKEKVELTAGAYSHTLDTGSIMPRTSTRSGAEHSGPELRSGVPDMFTMGSGAKSPEQFFAKELKRRMQSGINQGDAEAERAIRQVLDNPLKVNLGPYTGAFDPERAGFIEPTDFEETPYIPEARFFDHLTRGRSAEEIDWRAVERVKERLAGKIQDDTTETNRRGQELYDTITSHLEDYARKQGSGETMRHTDPRRHFTAEQIQQMIDDPKIREYEFNKLFTKADTQPSQPFQEVFNQLYDQPTYNAFVQNLQERGEQLLKEGRAGDDEAKKSKGEELLNDAQRYIMEYTYRSLIHDANYLIVANLKVEQMAGFMGRFSTEMADAAFRKKGVTPAMHFYEQALLKVKEENNGYLPYDEVVANSRSSRYSRVEMLARKYFDQALSAGFLRDAEGNNITQMNDWEVDRAMAFARGLGIITGRFVEIAATSRLPKNQFISMWAHNLIAEIAPFRHNIGKFFIGGERNRFLLYMLQKDRDSWHMDELKEIKNDDIFEIVNGLIPKENQRLMGKVNPWEIGGVNTRSTWRVGGNPDDKENKDPVYADTKASAIGGIIEKSRQLRKDAEDNHTTLSRNDDPFEYIGRGVIIEKNRYDFSNPEKSSDVRTKAGAEVKKQLVEIGKYLPTKLIFNVSEARVALEKKFGNDAFLREDFRNALDVLIVVQEKAVSERTNVLDFSFVENSPEKTKAMDIATHIKDLYVGSGNGNTQYMDNLLSDFRDRKWLIPYVFGTDDLPWDQYEYARTGGRSIERRWKDMLAASKASTALQEMVVNMPNVKSPGDLLGMIHKIHGAIEEYDAGIAEEVAKDLIEGCIWFFSKDAYAKGVMGELLSKFPGNRSSYAEFAFGRGAMAWDELATHDFINGAREMHMINDHIKGELMKNTKSKGKNVVLRVGEYFAYIILLAIALRSVNEAFKGGMRG